MRRKIRLMVVLELSVASRDGYHEPSSKDALDGLEQALHDGEIGHSVETARELHYGEEPLVLDGNGDIWHIGQ